MSEVPTRYLDYVQPKSRFAIWAWSPVIVLRIALFLVYAGFVFAATAAFASGIPVFDLTTPNGYTPVWAVALGVSAIVSAVGATTDRWQTLERWASLVLTAMMVTYTGALFGVGFAEGDPTRQFVAAVSTIALVLPATRFVYLAAQSGKLKRHVRNHPAARS